MDFPNLSRLLEFGVTAGLLVVVIVYILRVHIPNIIRAFEDGICSLVTEMKSVNKTLMSLSERLLKSEHRILETLADKMTQLERARSLADRETQGSINDLEEVLEETRKVVASVDEKIKQIL